jgi:MFS family permease
VAAAAALADGSIVTLALPVLLRDLHTGVVGISAVLIVYCAALAVALPIARLLAASHGTQGVGVAGLGLFGAASLVCAAAGSLPVLLLARTAQAIGAAGILLLAFSLLADRPARSRLRRLSLWRASALFGTAAGPALGGALTQAFSWQAIFLVQAPIALLAGLLCVRGELQPQTLESAHVRADADQPVRLGLALAATAAALSAVLFLLVLLLVSGGGLSPLRGALYLTLLTVSAIMATRARGAATMRATVGCLLLGAGVVMLAFLPRPSIWWLIVPELLAGIGMGLALPAFVGELLPERTSSQATRLLAIRFGAIAAALVALAPLVSSRLHAATQRGRLQGVAALVASPLAPAQKLSLAPELAHSIGNDDPYRALARTVARASVTLSPPDRRALSGLERQGDTIIFAVARNGLRDAFLIAGALGLLAALFVRPRRRVQATAIAAAASVLLCGAYAIAAGASRPPLPAVGAPCRPVSLPAGSGIAGFLQDAAIAAIDRVACARNLSREQFLLQAGRAVSR